MSNIRPVRGTRDFYPEDLRFRNWLFSNFRKVSRIHGFEEYDSPILENEELYTRKAGEEIVEQLYSFEDKSGRRVSLRPEMTPSLARMIMARATGLALPLKWFSIPQCWRYERMTRGRKREHYQWNMDIFGIKGVEAEAELLSSLVSFFTKVGLSSKDVGIRISNRKLLQSLLSDAGVQNNQFPQVCVIVDKLNKLDEKKILSELSNIGLTSSVSQRIIDLVSVKSLSDLSDKQFLSEAYQELNSLFKKCEDYGFSDWLIFDASIVRGVAYYTGTVFEAFDRGATLRAICGGGRYDNLLSNLGGQDIPACGFGFGDVVIGELLSDKDIVPELECDIDDVVFSFNSDLTSVAIDITNKLRKNNRSVDLVLDDKKIKWAIKHADKIGAKRLVLLAPNEWSRGKIKVRDLKTGDQSEKSISEL